MPAMHAHVPYPAFMSRRFAIAVFGLAALLGGCAAKEDIEAVIAETDAFCAAHPVPALPASVSARSVYIGPGGLTRAWTYWIPERLLQGGFDTVESDASIAPYITGAGEFLRFRIAPATDPGCAGQRALAAHMGPHEWSLTQRRLVDQGLGPDQCLAIERMAQRASPYWLEVWDASADLSDLHVGLPIKRQRIRYAAIEARSGRVMHEHVAEWGIVNAGMPTPFGCMRRKEWDDFSDRLVLGARASGSADGGSGVAPAGLDMVERPPTVEVRRADLQVESRRDLGGVPIDGTEFALRKKRARDARVEGFEILEGEETNPNVTHPDWPRYLQMSAGGKYRRVRLAWLEGEPHGMHERPVRLFDLGDRIGMLAVTRRMSPETRGAFDLSWTELGRNDGLPLRRNDAVMPIDPDSNVAALSLVENVQPGDDGLRFTLTEVGRRRGPGDASDFLLLRETRFFWPLE